MWESSEGEPVTDLYINLDKQTSSHTDTLIHTLTHTHSNTFIPRPRLELELTRIRLVLSLNRGLSNLVADIYVCLTMATAMELN